MKFIILFTKIDNPEITEISKSQPNMQMQVDMYINKIKDVININNYFYDYVLVSNITLHGYDLFIEKLSILSNEKINESSNNNNNNEINDEVDFIINNVYNIPETGNIVSGIVLNGTIKVGDSLLIGPYCGSYYPITISSIYRKEIEYESINKDEMGSFGIKFNDDIELNKYMSIINNKIFEKVLDITKNYEFSVKLYNICEKNNNSQTNESLSIAKTNMIFKTGYQCTLYIDNMSLPIIISNNNLDIQQYRNNDILIKFHFSKQMIGKTRPYKLYLRNKSKCVIKCYSNKLFKDHLNMINDLKCQMEKQSNKIIELEKQLEKYNNEIDELKKIIQK